MLLLFPDTVDLHGPLSTVDTYGSAEPDPVVVWTGPGNLQLNGGVSDPRASDGGGAGPYDPAQAPAGQLFLPDDAPVAEGCVADIRGAQYVLSQTYLAVDPVAGDLGCWVATAREVSSWPL